MRLSTTKNEILNAVLIAERITGKKESLPILSCVVLDVGKDLVLKATNLEAGIEIISTADIEEKGVVAVPASVLSQTLRSIMADKIMFSTEDGNLLIESRGTKTLIKSISHEEFPALPAAGTGNGIKIARERLLGGLQAAS